MRQSHLPQKTGVGLKAQHIEDIIKTKPDLGFFEVHAENYMGEGGLPHAQLAAIRENYALSLHGVGLSIGAERSLDQEHLNRLKTLIETYKPESFSEHLAWSTHDSIFLNDLLPLPYNKTTLERVIAHINQVQDRLNTQMLLENPSTYLQFDSSDIYETEFLENIAAATGCGLLLDINNVQVSAVNHNTNPYTYLNRFPLRYVKEIHLAGYAEDEDEAGARLLIDAHDSPVRNEVWALYQFIISKTGSLPTLIEWDTDVPEWSVLYAEAKQAENFMMHAAQKELASDHVIAAQ